MRGVLTVLVAVAFLGGTSGVDAASGKRKQGQRGYDSRSPDHKVYRNTSPRVFDETHYYERLSEKIPFGSAAWWRQKQLENLAP